MALLRTQETDGVLVIGFNEAKILDEAKIQKIGAELIEAATNAAQGKRNDDNLTVQSLPHYQTRKHIPQNVGQLPPPPPPTKKTTPPCDT